MRVLYVAHDLQDTTEMCPGSTVCLSLVKDLLDGMITIQDCDVLRKTKQLPDWLNGTPILVDDGEGVPYKGRDAVRKLRELVASLPVRTEPNNVVDARGVKNVPSGGGMTGGLDDHFKMDVQQVEEASNGKITEQDLQRYMEQRNASPAGQNAKAAVTA